MCSFMARRINIEVNYTEYILVFVEKAIVEKDFFKSSDMGKINEGYSSLGRSEQASS